MSGDMTMESAMIAFFEHQMRKVYTAIPAVIIAVRSDEKQSVDVKPLINQVFADLEDDTEHPIILHVPLIYPSSSTSAVTFPVHPGDTVMLVFSQVSTDVFKSGDGTIQPPSDYRRFNIRDAVAIPGLFPFGSAINQMSKHTLPHSTDDLAVFHNLGTSAECELRMKQTGKVEITSPLQVEVNAPVVNVTATTSATITAPAIYATASTLATITAPIAAITAAASATVTSPVIALTGATSVAVVSPTFTWNGSTVAVV